MVRCSEARDIEDGTPLALDGVTGTVLVEPDEASVSELTERANRRAEVLASAPDGDATLSDGERILVLANIGNRLGLGFSDGRKSALPSPTRFNAAPHAVSMAGDNITINVHAAPGMSEQTLVNAIMAKLNERSQAKQRRRNSSFFDKD